MAGMSAWERVAAALAGEECDHPPVSLWQHFPNRDQTAEALADATLAWQARYGFDFIKLMPSGDYPTIDWGARSEYRGNAAGTRDLVRVPVATADDWRRIMPVPVDRGMNRQVIDAARLVNERLGGAVPVLQTVFSPLTVAHKLSNGRVIQHLREHPDAVHVGLAAITGVTRQFVAATLGAGASGLFFATQCATTDLLTTDEYAEFGARYDRQLLAAADASRFTMLHIHGENIMFDALMDYPVHAINWHDRRTAPALAEGIARSGKCAAGGLHETAIATMTPDEAAAQARDAIATTGGRHLMVAPGCVIPIATPEATIAAITRAVREGH